MHMVEQSSPTRRQGTAADPADAIVCQPASALFLVVRGPLRVADERAEPLRDGPVAVAGGVLVDHRGPDDRRGGLGQYLFSKWLVTKPY
jgi:hypothetical protein